MRCFPVSMAADKNISLRLAMDCPNSVRQLSALESSLCVLAVGCWEQPRFQRLKATLCAGCRDRTRWPSDGSQALVSGGRMDGDGSARRTRSPCHSGPIEAARALSGLPLVLLHCVALLCSAIRVAFTFRNPCYAERGPLYETSALGAQAKSDGSPLACGLADWRTWLALDNARKRKGAGRAVGARFGLPLNRLQGGTDPRDGVCLVLVKSIEQGLSLSRS